MLQSTQKFDVIQRQNLLLTVLYRFNSCNPGDEISSFMKTFYHSASLYPLLAQEENHYSISGVL